MTEKDEKDTPQENSLAPDDDIDSLSEDEKAAFEKILAEINAGENNQGADTEPDQPSRPADANNQDEQLSDDQQAALDNIMAEINARDQKPETDTEPDQPSQSADANNQDEQLSDDQQAALDNIMAEINARDQKPETDAGPDQPSQPADANDQDEQLSDDQQAALDNIMAEINAREQKPETDTEPDQPSQPAGANNQDEQLSDDQQAALDKIMAEINAREQKPETDAGSEQQPDGIEESEITQETHSANETLSFDAFNEELDSLLSQAQQNAKEAAPTAAASKEMEPASKPKVEKETAALKPETPSLKYGPAPQPSELPPADQGADPEDAPPSTQTDPPKKSPPVYAVLQEIDGDQGAKPGPARRARKKGPRNARSGHLVKIASAAVAVLSTVGLVYWGLNLFNHRGLRKPVSAEQPAITQSSANSGAPGITIDLQPAPLALPKPVENVVQPPRQPALTPLGSLKLDLAAARKRVGSKIEEIVNLVAYYQEGIQEEHNKIRTVLQTIPMPSLERALADSQIELSIRAIQRRHAYISKLGAPLKQLKASSEELLFLERRTRLFETLSQWVSGPSIPQYKQEIADRIQTHMKVIKELSVDNGQMDLPSKASVWDEVQAGLKKEKDLAAKRSKTNTQNKLISQEICRGEYGRKYLLTHLSEEAATCLIQWNGKDLYLNGLTELSPQAARILAQWPGEWLSLNGVKEMSAETAKHLAQWPGKRLSLNGMEKLSPQATAQLSQWKGEQLEMIGLTVIGPWENYATRLYLSETMRRKLQM